MMNEIMPLKFHEIAIASPFETCFYCSGSLPAQTKEHIFNACLGGKHKTSQLICDECNKAFSEIDDSLFPYVQFVMNALGIKGERHREIPVIVSNTDRYVLKEFAKPEIAEPILEVIEDDNGNEKRVKLNTKSKSEARRQLLDGQLEERLGRQLTEPERETILKHIRDAKVETREVGKLEFSSQLDIQAEYRSAAHMIFKCLGFVDPDLVNSIDTHRIRQFSRYNENSWEEFAVLVEPIFSAGSHMEFLNESSFTEIYYSKYLKKVIGVLNILNRVKKAVVVCENYDGPDKIALIAEIPGGIIKAFSLDFNMELQFPICNISKRPPSPEDIAREFYNVVTNSVYIDAIQAPFLKKLQEIANKYGVVSEQSLAEYRSALAEFLKTISVLNQNPISVEKAFVVLDQLQFLNILAGYNGKRLDDDIVNKKIIVITENAMKNVLACR